MSQDIRDNNEQDNSASPPESIKRPSIIKYYLSLLLGMFNLSKIVDDPDSIAIFKRSLSHGLAYSMIFMVLLTFCCLVLNFRVTNSGVSIGWTNDSINKDVKRLQEEIVRANSKIDRSTENLRSLEHRLEAALRDRQEKRIEVRASSGWVHSGFEVKKGQKIHLTPSGRVHLAINHTFNSAQIVKPLVVKHTQDRQWNPDIVKRYPLPELNDTNVFYRQWAGPGGDDSRSDIFDNCKFKSSMNMGSLLCVVLPNADQEISSQDPFEVLRSYLKTGLDRRVCSSFNGGPPLRDIPT